MCGIAGLYYPALPKPIEPVRIAAMTNALAHRGPDGSGIWTAPGVGLGLSMVKQICEFHGGSVTVDSKLGEDSTFTIRLPII